MAELQIQVTEKVKHRFQLDQPTISLSFLKQNLLPSDNLHLLLMGSKVCFTNRHRKSLSEAVRQAQMISEQKEYLAMLPSSALSKKETSISLTPINEVAELRRISLVYFNCLVIIIACAFASFHISQWSFDLSNSNAFVAAVATGFFVAIVELLLLILRNEIC